MVPVSVDNTLDLESQGSPLRCPDQVHQGSGRALAKDMHTDIKSPFVAAANTRALVYFVDAMRQKIENDDRLNVVTPSLAPAQKEPKFEMEYVDTQSQEGSTAVRWPLTQREAMGIDLPEPWRASRDGQLIGAMFHGSPQSADVTYGFDF